MAQSVAEIAQYAALLWDVGIVLGFSVLIMQIFLRCPRIHSLWGKELATDSYYGLTMSCIERAI
jgi:hypothetical protein